MAGSRDKQMGFRKKPAGTPAQPPVDYGKVASDNFTNFMSGYNDPSQQSLSYSFDPTSGKFDSTTQGMMTGMNLSKLLTGQTLGDIGQKAKGISSQYEQMANQAPIAGDIALRGAQDQFRKDQAKAGMAGVDMSAANIQNLTNANFAAEAANRQEKRTNLDAFAQNLNAVAGTSMKNIYGQQSLALGKEPSPVVSAGGGMTIICTELARQGYLSSEVMDLDAEYGAFVRATRPEVYNGYIFLATPVVKFMKKSPMFSKFIAIFGVAWAKNMAGEYNTLGSVISTIGEPICGLVGKILKGKLSWQY